MKPRESSIVNFWSDRGIGKLWQELTFRHSVISEVSIRCIRSSWILFKPKYFFVRRLRVRKSTHLSSKPLYEEVRRLLLRWKRTGFVFTKIQVRYPKFASLRVVWANDHYCCTFIRPSYNLGENWFRSHDLVCNWCLCTINIAAKSNSLHEKVTCFGLVLSKSWLSGMCFWMHPVSCSQ